MLDCFDRGEAPYVSHLLYPRVLDDRIPLDRAAGMKAGELWQGICARAGGRMVVYVDHGISAGMMSDIANARKLGMEIERRAGLNLDRVDRAGLLDIVRR